MSIEIPKTLNETFNGLINLTYEAKKLFNVCHGLTWKTEGKNLTFIKKIDYSPLSIGYVYVANKKNKSQIIYIGETGKAFGRFEMVKSTVINFKNRERITNKRIKFAILELLSNNFTVKVYFFIPSNLGKAYDFDITIPSKQIETKLFELYKEKYNNEPLINSFRRTKENDYKTEWMNTVDGFIKNF